MQIILPPYPTYVNDQEMIVEHKGQEIRWSTAPFSKMNFEDDRAMFKHINGFWASLDPNRQDHIFSIYRNISEVFDSTNLIEEIDQLLSEQVEALMEEHPLAEIHNWAVFHSDIIFPQSPALPTEFVESVTQSDKNHTREKTYTVNDYINLVCMIIQLRTMIPVWGRYIARTNKIAGTVFKEFYAFKLLDHSSFVKEEPIQKLYGYIRSVLPASGNKADILQGISSEEFPLWNMSVLVVRKLCLSDIRGLDPTPILIRHISRHIMEKAKRIDANTDMSVRSKNEKRSKSENSSGGQSEENQSSLLEQYKIKEEVNSGDIQFLLSHVQNPYKVAKIITPGITDKEVDMALSAMPVMLKAAPDPSQTLLLSWLIDCVVPAETVNYMKLMDRCKSLCACSAAYWSKGHYLIAALCTATPAPDDGEVLLSGTDSKGRLSKETAEKIESLFPYGRRTRSNKIQRDELTAMDELITLFSAKSWVMNLTEDQIAVMYPKQPKIRRLTIPHNFKEQIAQLVIDIVSREPIPRVGYEEQVQS